MKSKWLWLLISCLVAAALILVSCGPAEEAAEEEEEEEEEEAEAEEEEEGTEGEGNWWDYHGEPQYGGTITWRQSMYSAYFDPATSFGGLYSFYMDTLFQWDWTVDRDIWPFKIQHQPLEYTAGGLAESWERPDATTFIVHLREGVYWQDKPPVNGREFTSDDVVAHYDRLRGSGHGYTKPAPFHMTGMRKLESITATDKYTVVFKLAEPMLIEFSGLLSCGSGSRIEAIEAVQAEGGSLSDWKNAVGTGPFILTDYVASSMVTYSRNPNYWGYDERYPENQLPYADHFRLAVIPDLSTAMAAIRTGTIDYLDGLDWERAKSLAKTNPEVQQLSCGRGAPSVMIRVDKEPFTDIRVRKAMNMAIDRATIAQTYYGGTVDGVPSGLLHPAYNELGYGFAYEDWPQELKEGYSYNPEKAKELLTAAGYPEGFDTNLIISSNADVEFARVIKGYLAEIDIDMEIRVMDPVASSALTQQREHDQLDWDSMGRTSVIAGIDRAFAMGTYVDRSNHGNVNDPTYEDYYNQIRLCTDTNKLAEIVREADQYTLEQYWLITTFPHAAFDIWQPYLKGYSGEVMGGTGGIGGGWIWARFWVDQDLKKSIR